MSTTVTSEIVMRTHYAVRVFLSAFHSLEACLSEKPNFIFTCYNLASLIDLPDMMMKYGPLRQIWEGNIRGEGFLRFAKPLMGQGFRSPQWHYNLMRKLLLTKAFDNILPQAMTQEEPVHSQDALRFRKGQFHKFKSQHEVFVALRAIKMEQKKPISVVLVKNKDSVVNVYAVVENFHSVIHIEMQTERQNGTKKFGFVYYKFDASNEDCIAWNEIAPTVVEIGYGILLPLLDATKGRDSCLHSLIASNWKTLSPSTSLGELVDVKSATFN